MVIRSGTLADLDAIVAVHSQARAAYYLDAGRTAREVDPPGATERRRETWAGILRSDAHVLCALWADQVVGIAFMAPPRSADADQAAAVCELYALHVVRSHWGRGVGSGLHSAYVEYARASSISTGELEVWDRNSRARSFYERRGWRLDGRQRIDSDGVYLRMRLDIDGAAVQELSERQM